MRSDLLDILVTSVEVAPSRERDQSPIPEPAEPAADILDSRLGCVHRALGVAVAQLGCGLAVLDENDRVRFVNAALRGMLGTGLGIRNGRLVADCPGDRSALAVLLAAARSTSAQRCPPSLALGRGAGGMPLLVQAVPLPSCEVLPRTSGRGAGTVLLAHDLTMREGTRAEPHLVRLGLTAGQARIAAAIGEGLSPRQAASRLGLAESTVRTILKSVYQRLGLSRQSHLAALVTRLACLD